MSSVYVTMQLTSGQTILAKLENELEGGHYVVHYPIKPVNVGDRLVFVAMNPFSDDTIYHIHPSHVITVSSMHFKFIDMYNEAVDKIDNSFKNTYEDLTSPVSDITSIEVDGSDTLH